jgi:hypothetical protein
MLLKKPTQIQELHQVFAMVQEYEIWLDILNSKLFMKHN